MLIIMNKDIQNYNDSLTGNDKEIYLKQKTKYGMGIQCVFWKAIQLLAGKGSRNPMGLQEYSEEKRCTGKIKVSFNSVSYILYHILT